MTLLAELIKKRESRVVATAIPAIPAIPATKVAKVAKVARVNPQTDQIAEPTRAEKMHEIHLLANFVGTNEGWTEEEILIGRERAQNDLENALLSFRELAADCRLVKVNALLESNPGSLRAVYTDTQSNLTHVILTIAIRGKASCEMRIPKARYDPFQLLDLIEKYGNQTH